MTIVGERPMSATGEPPFADFLNANASFIADASAPQSPLGILRATYPGGMTGGQSPVGAIDLNFEGAPRRYLYHAWWSKFSANFYGHLSNMNKMAYYRTPAHNGLFVFIANGSGTGTLVPMIALQGTATYGTTNLFSNLVPGATIPRGQWNLVEVVAVGNTAGNTDGSIDVYLNGVHVISYAMQWESGGTTWGFLQYYPGWGGAADTVPYDMTMDVDHWYVSGKN